MAKWEVVRLGDVCLKIGNENPTGYNKKIIYIDIASVDSISKTILEYNEITSIDAPSRARQKVQVGDILVSTVRPNLNAVAMIDYNSDELIASTGFCVLRPNTEKVSDRYIFSFVKSPYFVRSMAQQATGASYPAVSNKIVLGEEIPLPPLETQQKIAEVLDKASSLIEKRKAQIAKLDLLVKSQFIEMFGDPVTNPMGWEIKRLEEYTLFLTSGSRGWSGYFSDDGEMFLTIKNVKNSSINIENIQYVHAPDTKEAERTRVKEGDLLISITADLGRTGVVSTEIADYGAYINQHLSLVRLDRMRINPNFVSHYLETTAGKNQFESKNQVGVKAGLNFNAINSLAIIAPPLELQNSFITFVKAADKSKFEMRRQLQKMERNYQSLMQKCFRGEIF